MNQTGHNHCCCKHCEEPSQPLPESTLPESSETRTAYLIPAMDCPMEEELIRKRLKAVPGIEKLEFNLMQRVLTVDHAPGRGAAIEAALKSINMMPERVGGKRTQITQAIVPWRKLAWAAALACLSELLELLSEWNIGIAGINFSSPLAFGISAGGWLSLLLALLAIIIGGLGTFKKGWIALSNLELNINALMAIAVTGAMLIGQFPEAAMVMALFNISEAIEALALDRSREAIRELLELAPETATVKMADGAWQEQTVDSIKAGSLARVKPGERIALDGEVVAGASLVNQAPITGESIPVEKRPGDFVYGGSLNESGSFEFRVTAPASASTLARIIEAVEKAQATRAPMQRFIDAFAKWYTPAVFLIAIFWAIAAPLLFGQTWLAGIYTALVILVIGCPCALVISTPVTIVSSMSAATKNGILVKGGLFLEQARKLNWLALDKTGTVTAGKPQLSEALLTGTLNRKEATALAASLAARSDHPVSRALAEVAEKEHLDMLEVEDFAALPGMGIRGKIAGARWYLGNLRLVKDLQLQTEPLAQQVEKLEAGGQTVVTLIGNDAVQAIFAVADQIRPTSKAAILELEKMGIKTILLTGDNRPAAAAIARDAGVTEFRAELLPDDKLRIIEDLEKQGYMTGMVGDGINDAPALARANISFAMARAGTDTAIETADVALMDDDLRKIPCLVRLSRTTGVILMENISFALAIKAFFFVITLMGLATMWMAVFADVGAALIVVANGMRARTKFPKLAIISKNLD